MYYLPKSRTAKLTSTENGRIKEIEAAHIRNDIVLRILKKLKLLIHIRNDIVLGRLQDPTVDSYTMKKTLDKIMVVFLIF